MADSKLNEIIRTSLENLRSMSDANTVIGDAITTPDGTTIIPVSKIFVGYTSGGVDYLSKYSTNDKNIANFGGGSGSGLSVSPVAFLVISKNGDVRLLNINNPENTPTDPIASVISLIDRSPEIIEKLKGIFAKKDAEETEETETEPAEPEEA